jgi:phosphopantetheinyl transferase (holo-ACP synthase)
MLTDNAAGASDEPAYVVPPLSGGELSLISELAHELSRLAREIAAKEAEVKALKEKYAEIETGRLPDVMLDIGMLDITLTDGSKLTRVVEYHPAIKVENRPAAFAYLREHELGDVIKTEITITYSKGEEKLAKRQLSYLMRTKANFERKIVFEENIHPSTLKALVKERVNADEPLPADIFGIHEITRAVIKLPRGAKV